LFLNVVLSVLARFFFFFFFNLTIFIKTKTLSV